MQEGPLIVSIASLIAVRDNNLPDDTRNAKEH